MTPNGSPSWKIVAFAIATITSLLIGLLVNAADGAIQQSAQTNMRQDREIAASVADLNNLADRLDQMQRTLDRMDANLLRIIERRRP